MKCYACKIEIDGNPIIHYLDYLCLSCAIEEKKLIESRIYSCKRKLNDYFSELEELDSQIKEHN